MTGGYYLKNLIINLSARWRWMVKATNRLHDSCQRS